MRNTHIIMSSKDGETTNKGRIIMIALKWDHRKNKLRFVYYPTWIPYTHDQVASANRKLWQMVDFIFSTLKVRL